MRIRERASGTLLVLLAIALAGCGGGIPHQPPAQPPAPPAVVDVADMLFSTAPARLLDTKQAMVFGNRVLLALVTWDPGKPLETHSVFQQGPSAILYGSEESWNRPPTVLQGVQDYPEHKAWVNALKLVPGAAAVKTACLGCKWTWHDNAGHSSVGTFDDVTLAGTAADGLSGTVKEWYRDALSDPLDYCYLRTYRKLETWTLTRIDAADCSDIKVK